MASGSTAMLRRAAELRPSRLYVFMSGQRGAFWATRWICAAPQSRPWSARRDGIAHSARQQGRRYPLRL